MTLGEYDPATDKAIRNFQRHKFGWDDGVVSPGANTVQALNEPDAVGKLDISALRNKGYSVYPVEELTVLNSADGLPNRHHPDGIAGQEAINFDVVVNGTFFFHGKLNGQVGKYPAGPVVRTRNGETKLDYQGTAKSKQRGAVAILEDGTIKVGLTKGGTLAELNERFAEGENQVKELMGGGALLINEGHKVSTGELFYVQNFDQGDGGINAQQMRATRHTLVVQDSNGQTYVVTNNRDKGGRTLQNDLKNAGAYNAVKFDGGSKFYDSNKPSYRNAPLAFGIRLQNDAVR